MIDDRLCSDECRLYAGWKTTAITNHHLLDTNRKRQFYPILHESVEMYGVSQKPGSRDRDCN